MDTILFTSKGEETRFNALKREHKENFERTEMEREAECALKGTEFTPQDYEPISDDVVLATIRAGWRSPLDKAFERKSKKEGWNK
ncbi:MAG: hypothetical protein IKZ62_03385 [Prevotella sp.]|nr:hypothetical protein [Prevotella sp.]